MKSFEFVKFIATAENKDKVCPVPATIHEVEDWNELLEGLKVMLNLSYAYIKSVKDCDIDVELPIMKDLNCAGTNIQYATAQMLATYTAFYDLQNKIIEHNKAINDKKA